VNPIERGVRTVDAWQQRHAVPSFLFAVVKKFGDDNGGYLLALLTYFAFLATFPLLLALVGILGIDLRNHPALEQRLVNSAFSEFPIIGPQLHSQLGLSSLHHSGPGVVIGIIVAVLGGRGLANAVQYTLNTAWQVPKVDWPGFAPRYLRSFALLALMGLGAVATAGTAAAAGGAGQLIGLPGQAVQVLAVALSTLLNSALFLAAFRLGAAKRVATRDLIMGAVLSAIAWQVLLVAAGVIIAHDLRHAQAVAGLFGIVLGLLAWFALQATVTVFAIEADVVRARRLWPRSLTQPPLTSGDRRYLAAVAALETRRPEQRVTTTFTPAADHNPLHDRAATPTNATTTGRTKRNTADATVDDQT
jgi:YihY family inner membrane protein